MQIAGIMPIILVNPNRLALSDGDVHTVVKVAFILRRQGFGAFGVAVALAQVIDHRSGIEFIKVVQV